MEDDADWDVMIRAQLTQFAYGARYIQQVADISALHSPYGDDWDFLPIGHCGARSRPEEDSRYWVAHNDPTVTPDSVSSHQQNGRVPDRSAPELQGNFTRLIYELRDMRCTYSYAVSLRGAQRMLYWASIEPGASSSDRVLSGLCTFRRSGTRCIAPWPPIVDTYRPAGPDSKGSDRINFKGEARKHGETVNIVFPVKTGLKHHVESHRTYASQWPKDSLRDAIDPNTDTLPLGKGYFLTKDKFTGYL